MPTNWEAMGELPRSIVFPTLRRRLVAIILTIFGFSSRAPDLRHAYARRLSQPFHFLHSVSPTFGVRAGFALMVWHFFERTFAWVLLQVWRKPFATERMREHRAARTQDQLRRAALAPFALNECAHAAYGNPDRRHRAAPQAVLFPYTLLLKLLKYIPPYEVGRPPIQPSYPPTSSS